MNSLNLFLCSEKFKVKFIKVIGKERKTFNKYYQYFQKLIMNSWKQQIRKETANLNLKAHGLLFVSSLNIITDSNRFYQLHGTSKALRREK